MKNKIQLNETEHLLVIAQEECGEIIQNISKALRFGLDNHHPDNPQETNAYLIQKEYEQLRAVMELLIVNEHMPPILTKERHEIYREKQRDIRHWMGKAREFGTLE